MTNYGADGSGNNNAGQAIAPSTAVTHRQNHKRNSNAGGIAKIGRTGMMTPNGMMNEGHAVNKQKIIYQQAHQTIDITDNQSYQLQNFIGHNSKRGGSPVNAFNSADDYGN